MFRKPSAHKLDSAAKKLHDTGTRIGGATGGKVGDAIANTVLAPIRRTHDNASSDPR